MQLLYQLTHGLSHLFYPRICQGCRRPLIRAEHTLCLQCLDDLPRTNHHHIPDNETTLRFAGRFPFINASSFAYFTAQGLLQHLLHGLKYKGKKETGIFLGRQFGYALQHSTWIKTIDLIIPVPLHPRKEAARGYNQTAFIAEGMSSVLHIPYQLRILSRIRDTESQTKKTREERAANMRLAFRLNAPSKVRNKHVLLLDDVLTTGATLEACALCLLQAPGVHISLATIGLAS